MTHAIVRGDVLETLRRLPDSQFDGLFCDPPYGFRFMGKAWDYDVPSVDVWREALRVLKPGAPLLSFGGARTYHRIAIGIEDAGFELRDCLMWLYGKGFPKSQNIGLAIDKAAGAVRPVTGTRVLTGNAGVSLKDKRGTYGVQVGSAGNVTVSTTGPATALAQQWDGYGTALKPAFEPCVLARKPLAGTMAQNIEAHGVGGLAIDACRIEGEGGGTACSNRDADGNCLGHSNAGRSTSGETFHGPDTSPDGRWPANLALDEEAAALLDASAGNIQPSRFFYCGKVSTKERERGCEGLALRSAGETTDREDDSAGLNSPRAGAGRTAGARNHHPTLEPIALARWLASLIKPPTSDARLLIPYSGAGSEIIGALQAGWPMVLGIEGESDYVEIAQARIAAWMNGGPK